MIRRCLKLSFISAVFMCVSCAGNYSPHMVQQELSKIFGNTQIIRVEESEIKGLYEVYYNGTYPGIIYYYPEKRLIIFGEIWTLNGESITGKKLARFLDELTEKYLQEEKDLSPDEKKRNSKQGGERGK